MHMIYPYIHFKYFYTFPFADSPYLLFDKFCYIALQYPISILWSPYNVIRALIEHMRYSFPFRHGSILSLYYL